jgi:hypothetical protein
VYGNEIFREKALSDESNEIDHFKFFNLSRQARDAQKKQLRETKRAFPQGVYQNGLSGLTHGCSGMQGGCGANHTTFSAYRLHADDPLVVHGPEMHSETWRNGNIRSNNI